MPENRLRTLWSGDLLTRGVSRYGGRRPIHLIQTETTMATVAFCGRRVNPVRGLDPGRRISCSTCHRAARELGYDV